MPEALNKSKLPARRILMVNTSYGTIGGVERYLLQISRLLKSQGWHVFGLFQRREENTAGWDDTFEETDFYIAKTFDNLIRKYQSLKLDFVFFHKVNDAGLVSGLQNSFRSLCLIHDHDYYCLRKHKYFPYKRINCHLPFTIIGCSLCSGLMEKQNGRLTTVNLQAKHALLSCMRHSDATIVLSEHMRRNALINGWCPDKIYKLNPIVTFENKPEKHQVVNNIPVILYVGQLVRGKGVDLLLTSLSQIKQPYKCVFVGAGNDAPYLKKIATELKIAEHLEWVGWTSEIDLYYAKADVLAVPSRWQEPFGLIGIEAFSHKLPVVAYDVGGISEWLKHKVNGILVKEGNAFAFAKALTKLLSDSQLSKEYGLNGFNLVQKIYTESNFLTGFREICHKMEKMR